MKTLIKLPKNPGHRVGSEYAPTPDAMLLTKRQKATLAQLARRVAATMGLPTSGAEHEAWRAEESVIACGRRISQARQGDFNKIRAQFEKQIPGSGPAIAARTAMRDQGNKARIALWRLNRELEARGLDRGYAEHICRCEYRCDLAHATAPQLWRLVFTVRNRRAPIGQGIQDLDAPMDDDDNNPF